MFFLQDSPAGRAARAELGKAKNRIAWRGSLRQGLGVSGTSFLRRPFAARAVLVLALLAALLRAAVPVGFMPTAKDGVFEVVICSSDGSVAHASMDLDGEAPPPASTAGDHCVFAMASAAAAPSATVSIAAPVAIDRSAPSHPMPDLAPGRGLAAPPPPSHAPPVLI